jgi:threonine dehydratase
MENIQIPGSFKLRGALNKILSLSNQQKKQGIITASSGNHGAAIAYILNKFKIKGTIFLPENASSSKIDHLRLYGANIKQYGDDCVLAEAQARKTAEKKGLIYVSPYNDIKIIGGQGTIGIELERQLKKPEVVLCPVGGGGLISGVGGYLKHTNPDVKIIGCQPENSAVMYKSIQSGRILDMPSLPTLSDGTAGGIEQGSITFELCRKYVDDFYLVSEEEIKQAIKLVIEKHCLLIEGGAALPVAAFLKYHSIFKGKNVSLILSGSRISRQNLAEIICGS